MDWLWQRISGLRTLIVAAAFGVLGVLEAIGTVDLTPIIGHYVSDKDQVGYYMALMAVVFAALRCVSRTPVGVRDQDVVQSPDGYMKHNLDDPEGN